MSRWRNIAALLLVLACVAQMCGCKATDVLVEVIYDQAAAEVDYDNPEKHIISDETAEEADDTVAASETSDSSENATATQNLVVYGSEENTTGLTAKQSLFAKIADFLGIEASGKVSLYYSTDDDAIEYEVPEPDENDEPAEDSENGLGSGSATGSEGSAGAEGSGAGEADAGEDDSDGEDGEGAGAAGIVEIIDTTDEFADPTPASKIAAFGEAAVIVQMVGGEGALACADSELLGSSFSKVFADEGASSIACGWAGDGTDASTMDVDAVIASGATTILVYSSSYENGLTVKQAKKLKAAGVTFTVIATLTNSTYIKKDVTTVGKILAEAEGIGNAGQTKQVAADYVSFHDALVKAAKKASGGKLAGSAVYEAKNSTYSASDCDSDANYTLLIDGYDSTATYNGTYYGYKLDSTGGVALASVGTASSPVSFYIQAGGLINNACECSAASDTGKMVVWQFSFNHLPFSLSKWTYASDGELAQASDVKQVGNGWGKTLLSTAKNRSSVYGDSFGSESFPKLIVTSAAYKKALIANSKLENGLYHPFDFVKIDSSNMNFFGEKVLAGSDYVPLFACVGANSSEVNAFANESGNAISEDSIEVNPTGLFSSWVAGSVESVLEAAWVSDVVSENSTISVEGAEGWEEVVEYFYSTFYRYDLSAADLSTITAGE